MHLMRISEESIGRKASVSGEAFMDDLRTIAKRVGKYWEMSKEDYDKLVEKYFEYKWKSAPLRVTKVITSFLKSGMKLLTKEQAEMRIDVCKTCEHWRVKTVSYCNLCKCSKAKAYIPGQTCPIGKWETIDLTIKKQATQGK